MAGPDYQMALRLQRQLEHENLYQSDLHLARKLQEDFNREVSVENPIGLVYDNKKKSEEDKRSLIDPSWELVDPTPNIHNLFVAFSQRFFWNKLLTVCVSWSKRMTSCAGICSYQGRGGMCNITLSEPLLKLRPRKDLVETLLHEMIHAYLFVTHNNRDRDGHGPEFHKHMFRINKEAGTSITVYHNFHDEVRLYLQHWWRCNGPCQNRKPYFGMVRRAMNRAPGPNDRWWAEHSQSCGGTFIKVKEPEKNIKNQNGNKQIVSKLNNTSDIRSFISVTSKGDITKTIPNMSNNPKENANVYGINNSTQNNSKIQQILGKENIHGFTNLSNATVNRNTNSKVTSMGGSTKTKSNSNSTVVINKKFGDSSNNKVDEVSTKKINVFSGTGNALILPEKAGANHDKNDYSVVRNHWTNKYSSVPTSPKKRDMLDTSASKYKMKKMKHETPVTQENLQSNVINLDESTVNCPVCDKQMPQALLNDHLDMCLQQTDTNMDKEQSCFVCDKKIPQADYRSHIESCFNDNLGNDEDLIECEICNIYINKSMLEMHRKLCLEAIFSASSTVEDLPGPSKLSKNPLNVILSQCPVCDDFVESETFNTHKEKCLLKVFVDLDNKHDLKKIDEEVQCLVCNRNVLKSELNVHLDECMHSVFDEKNDFNAPSTSKDTSNAYDTHTCDNEGENKYNCPFCMELYTELDMSGHLDQCLADDENDSNNKSILMNSFSNDDVL